MNCGIPTSAGSAREATLPLPNRPNGIVGEPCRDDDRPRFEHIAVRCLDVPIQFPSNGNHRLVELNEKFIGGDVIVEIFDHL
jgi:hypothetical protein